MDNCRSFVLSFRPLSEPSERLRHIRISPLHRGRYYKTKNIIVHSGPDKWLMWRETWFSGIGTASVYCDGTLRRNGFPFECHGNWSEVLVVKSHLLNGIVHVFWKWDVLWETGVKCMRVKFRPRLACAVRIGQPGKKLSTCICFV